jgi:hypothetical protein
MIGEYYPMTSFRQNAMTSFDAGNDGHHNVAKHYLKLDDNAGQKLTFFSLFIKSSYFYWTNPGDQYPVYPLS